MVNDQQNRTSELRRIRRNLTTALADVDRLLTATIKVKRRWTTKPTGVGWDDLNPRERAVLRFIASRSDDVKIVTVAARVFGKTSAHRAPSAAKALSWARNSVRRPMREGMLRRTEPGTFGVTAKGHRELL